MRSHHAGKNGVRRSSADGDQGGGICLRHLVIHVISRLSTSLDVSVYKKDSSSSKHSFGVAIYLLTLRYCNKSEVKALNCSLRLYDNCYKQYCSIEVLTNL